MTKHTIAKHHYSSQAIVLHWLLALSLIPMLAGGFAMTNLDLSQAFQFQLYQWHKAAGVLILWAVFARVIIRLLKRPPPHGKALKEWEKKAASFGHIGLYIAMILMPLSGWVMVSASPFGLPTIVFGLFEWPHIPGIAGNKNIETIAKIIHFYTAFAFAALITIHIAAALKHTFLDAHNVLKRMWWQKNQAEDKTP